MGGMVGCRSNLFVQGSALKVIVTAIIPNAMLLHMSVVCRIDLGVLFLWAFIKWFELVGGCGLDNPCCESSMGTLTEAVFLSYREIYVQG
jgi:hypothetical protein